MDYDYSIVFKKREFLFDKNISKFVFLIKTRYRIISNYIIYLLLLFYLVNKTRLLSEMFFSENTEINITV